MLDKNAEQVSKAQRQTCTELTMAGVIISHTHVQLQLCIVAPNHIAIACNGTDGDYSYLWSDNTEL